VPHAIERARLVRRRPADVEGDRVAAHAWFRAAVRDRVVTTSPCVDIRKPAKPPASTLEVLSRADVFALAAEMPERYHVYGDLIADEEDGTWAAIDAEFGLRRAPDCAPAGWLTT
jgi:hypothetical protein